MKTIFQNTSAAQEPAEVPTREDGSKYPLLAFLDGGWLGVAADTQEEILAEIIPEYDEIVADETGETDPHYEARLDYMLSVQSRLQGSVLAEFWSVKLTPQESELLTNGGDALKNVESWTSAVPIVLVADYYTPHTDVPQPFSGNDEPAKILWLNATTVETFLRSLAEAGEIALLQPVSTTPVTE